MNYTMRCSTCGVKRLVSLPDELETARELFFRKEIQDVIVKCCGTWELHEITEKYIGNTGTTDMLQLGTPDVSNDGTKERASEGIRVVKNAVGDYPKGD